MTCQQKIITLLTNEKHEFVGSYFYTRLSFIGFWYGWRGLIQNTTNWYCSHLIAQRERERERCEYLKRQHTWVAKRGTQFCSIQNPWLYSTMNFEWKYKFLFHIASTKLSHALNTRSKFNCAARENEHKKMLKWKIEVNALLQTNKSNPPNTN